MHKLIVVFSLLVLIACNEPPKPVIYMAGDSTMADKPLEGNPERGWGQLLPSLMDTSSICIENHAKNGRSTRSFIYEGRWDSLIGKVRPNDYVVIQFGHNDDVVTKTGRYTLPGEFRYNLVKFVRDVREKGASPILCTPIVRRKFNESGQLEETHGVYPDVVREVASAMNVPLADLHERSKVLVTEQGDDASKALYLHIPPGQYPTCPNGKADDTHFSETGARTWAGIFLEELKKIHHPLTAYTKRNEP
ncbi:MAG TPA: rhamnogalacturonan acetylesterase [Prolixibacteraceae bacterium]|nr:rhamnogalacturonan acetylesterase [Prolixibacteraceae bacterium]